MARLIGAYAASHAPRIAREWASLPAARKERLARGYRELGRRIEAQQPDVIIEISPDHWVNFFIDNLPAVCIGVGDAHDGPPEPFMADFPHRDLAGHSGLGQHLARAALAADFEPSLSYRLRLDHGFCVPLWRMELDRLPAIVPVVVNCLEPPMPSVNRCLAWGRLVADAIASYPEDLKVAILASGGISHSIGEPTMGEIDEAFDHDCIEAFTRGDGAGLVAFLDRRLAETGNGAHEMRNWVIAHAAAGSSGFELIEYLPVPEVYVGCAFAAWRVPPGA